MVVVKLMGGLGNQLFQYAIARSLAARNNTQLKLDHLTGFKNDFYGRVYSLQHFNIQENLITNLEINKMFDIKKTKTYYAILFPISFVKIIFWASLFSVFILVFAILFPELYILPLTFSQAEITGWLFIFSFINLLFFSLYIFYNSFLRK